MQRTFSIRFRYAFPPDWMHNRDLSFSADSLGQGASRLRRWTVVSTLVDKGRTRRNDSVYGLHARTVEQGLLLSVSRAVFHSASVGSERGFSPSCRIEEDIRA